MSTSDIVDGAEFTTIPPGITTDTLQLWGYLPTFLKVQDANLTTSTPLNQYVFLRWLNGIGVQQQIVDTLVRDTRTKPGWSIVLDVSRCPAYALPWLAQFVGVRFKNTQIGTTQAMRSAILAKGGFSRGTVTALKASVQQYLAPGGYVQIIERYSDPYRLRAIVHGALNTLSYAELAVADPTYPDVTSTYPFYDDFPSLGTAVIIGALKAALPGGLLITVEFATTFITPTLDIITPATGSRAGGTIITLTGTGFLTGITVTIGGHAGTTITVINGTTLTFKAPSHTSGTVTVTVTTTHGTSNALTFKYTGTPS